MSVRATAKGKIDVPLEPSKIRECVMLTVVEHGANVMDQHLICLCYGNNVGIQTGDGQKYGKRI